MSTLLGDHRARAHAPEARSEELRSGYSVRGFWNSFHDPRQEDSFTKILYLKWNLVVRSFVVVVFYVQTYRKFSPKKSLDNSASTNHR
jgi:hypothetical protein